MSCFKKLVLIGLILTVVGSTNAYSVSTEELNQLNNRIEQTKKKLSETKSKENSVLGNLLKTQQELEKINDNLERLDTQIKTTVSRLDTVSSQLTNAQNELQRIEIEIGGREGLLDERLVAFYKYGYQGWIEVLVTSQNFIDFIERIEMVQSYIRNDFRMLRSLHSRQELILQKKAEIATKKQELTGQRTIYISLQKRHQAEKSRWMSLYQRNKTQLTALRNDRKALESALDEMLRTSKEMEEKIREYQKRNQSGIAGTGSQIWPVRGRISSYFGYRYHPILKKRKYHTGLDIAAPEGTPIIAADSGVIIFSGVNGGYGKMIAIDHGKEFSTLYGHCSVLLIEEGAAVEKGQIIAKVGTTGLSTGPHLHFEVRKNGRPVDPVSYLPKN